MTNVFALQNGPGPGAPAVFALQAVIPPVALAGAASARATASGRLTAVVHTLIAQLRGAATARATAVGQLVRLAPASKALAGAATVRALATGLLQAVAPPAKLLRGAAVVRALASGQLAALAQGVSLLRGAATVRATAAGLLRAAAPAYTGNALVGSSNELRRVTVDSDSAGLLGKFFKQPRETLDYCFDFGPWLRDCNDALQGHSLLVTGSAVLRVAESVSDGRAVVALVTQGADKTSAKLTCIASTVGGRTKEVEILIRVKDS